MRQDLSQILSEHLSLYGYERNNLPIIQPAEIFLTRAGDSIIHRLFVFERYGQTLALRPEFTSAAARKYVLDQHTGTIRWHFVGPIFEDLPDSPFKNQRPSVGAELIHAEGVLADQEIISMATKGIQLLPLEGWKLVLGNIALQKHLLAQSGDNRQYRLLLDQRETLKTSGLQEAEKRLRATLSQIQEEPTKDIVSSETRTEINTGSSTNRMLDVLLDSTQYGTTMGGRSREDIAERILHKRMRARDADELVKSLEVFANWTALRGDTNTVFEQIEVMLADGDNVGLELLNNWRELVRLIVASGIPEDRIVLQPNLARNWEYYTGIVFGIEVGDKFVAAGGRYDDLAQLITDAPERIPAVGFTYYIDTLHSALSLPEDDSTNPIYVIATAEQLEFAFDLANRLRKEGIPTIVSQPPDETYRTIHIQKDGSTKIENAEYTDDNLDSLITELRDKRNND